MAEGSPESISVEAFQRVERERDSLKAQAADAAKAIRELGLERKLAQHFGSKGYANAFDVAARARLELGDTPEEELPAKAEAWYEQQRRLFAAPTAEAASEPAPPSPWEQAPATPLPSGGRVPITGTPLVMGTPEFAAWSQGKTLADVNAAKKTGDVVVPDKVKLAQGSVPFGG